MMIVKINGKSHEIAEKTTLKNLINNLGISDEGTAIALNDTVVSYHQWQDTVMSDGDTIVIIKATQGG